MAFALLLVAVPASLAGATEIYRWTDENGVKHITNYAPPEQAEVLMRTPEIPYDAEADRQRQEAERRERMAREKLELAEKEARLERLERALDGDTASVILEVVQGEGYSAVKFDVDHTGVGKLDRVNWTAGAKEMSHIISLIEGVREGIGYEIDLAIDCHGQFDLPSAITLAKAVEPLRLMWLEEPLPAENVDALAQVRASTSTVICTGENQYTRFDFLELLRQGINRHAGLRVRAEGE